MMNTLIRAYVALCSFVGKNPEYVEIARARIAAARAANDNVP
jgi:hypothetical protein